MVALAIYERYEIMLLVGMDMNLRYEKEERVNLQEWLAIARALHIVVKVAKGGQL